MPFTNVTNNTQAQTAFANATAGAGIGEPQGGLNKDDHALWAIAELIGGFSLRPGETGVTNAMYPVGDVRRYGAKCDGVTDDTTAIQLAINAVGALGSGIVFLPAGAYKITAALDATSFYGIAVVGEGHNASPTYRGSNASQIIQYTANVPVLKVYGPCRVENLYLGYATQQVDTATSAIALELNNIAGSSFRNIRTWRSAIGFGIPQVGFAATGYNFMFDATFDNVTSYEASLTHYDFRNFNAGGTNCRFNGVYINGGGTLDFVTPGTTAQYAIRGASWSGYEWGAVSIDGLTFSQRVMDVTNCHFTVDTIRTEACTCTKDNDGWYGIGGADNSADFRYVEVRNCRALIASVPTATYLFRPNSVEYRLNVGAIRVTSDCSFTTPIARPLSLLGTPTAAGSDVRIGRIANAAAGFTSTTWTDGTSGIPIIRLWDAQDVAARRKSGQSTTTHQWDIGSAIPSSGTYAVGDRRTAVSPGDLGRPIGWICVAAGTPGTWIPEALSGCFPVATQGDADVTLTPGTSRPVCRYGTALTANRTVTLSTTGAWNGARFEIVRAGLGAFTLDVGGLKTIPSATAATVTVTYDGSAWRLTGYDLL